MPLTLYKCVVADPPWQPTLHAANPRRRTLDKAGPQRFYETMNIEQIIALKPNFAPQAHLYVWGINAHLDWAFKVYEAWGAEPVTVLTWCKPGMGVGRFQSNTEHVVVSRIGPRTGNPFGFEGQHASPTNGTWFNWPRGRHSAKPQEFFDLVDKMSPGPKLEMYARSPRQGWDVFGNEVLESVKTP